MTATTVLREPVVFSQAAAELMSATDAPASRPSLRNDHWLAYSGSFGTTSSAVTSKFGSANSTSDEARNSAAVVFKSRPPPKLTFSTPEPPRSATLFCAPLASSSAALSTSGAPGRKRISNSAPT
jgi:hypothetical protein